MESTTLHFPGFKFNFTSGHLIVLVQAQRSLALSYLGLQSYHKTPLALTTKANGN